MKIFGYVLITIITLTSLLNACSQDQPKLISWSKQFVMDGYENEDLYFENHDSFIADYFSVEIKGDTLIATTLMFEHCFDSAVGIIEILNETIFLKTKNTAADERLCPEFYKYRYVIYNPDRSEYKVVSEK